MGYTQESFNRTNEMVKAIVNGELNIDEMKETFEKKPFEFYLRRFVAEKQNKKIEDIGYDEILIYIQSNIDDYDEEYKNILQRMVKFNTKRVELNKQEYPDKFLLYNKLKEKKPRDRSREEKDKYAELSDMFEEKIFFDYKTRVRKCLEFPKDCIDFPIAVEKVELNKIEKPELYATYKEIKKKNRDDRTEDEKSIYKELSDLFSVRVEPREMTRDNLLKLFFYLNCSAEEASELLYRLGENGFYFKSRYEAMIWWSLKQENNKFVKFMQMYNDGFLTKKQIAISFGNEKTDVIRGDLSNCKTDFDFEHKLLYISTEDSNHKSIRDAYENCLKKINEQYNFIFRNEHLQKDIKQINDEIEKFSEQIYYGNYSSSARVIKEVAIFDRENKLVKLKNEHYEKIKNISASSEITTLLNNYSIENNFEVTNLFQRSNGIINGTINDIRRNDIINIYFFMTVINEFYDSDSEDLFDVIKLEKSDLLEVIKDFQDGLSDALSGLDFMELNLGNPYEAYLVLCLATGNPLHYFCRSITAFNNFDKEE